MRTTTQIIIALLAAFAFAACGGGGGDFGSDAGTDTDADTDTDDSAYGRQSAWCSAPMEDDEPPTEVFEDETLRQIVYVTAGGARVRVKLSNLFGTAPVFIDRTHIAVSTGDAAIDPATDTELTFNSGPSVAIPAGEEVWSDSVPFAANPLTNLAVSIYLGGETEVLTYHQASWRTNYVHASGDQVSEPVLGPCAQATSYFLLTAVDTLALNAGGTIVAFGDSITEGYGSTIDANNRYPDSLARRLNESGATIGTSVVNAGISGNRVLNDYYGPAGIGRFERDALGQSGVSHVIIMEGLNDIGFSGAFGLEDVTADDIIEGLTGMVEAAGDSGVHAILGTLTPFAGYEVYPLYYSDEGEAKRQDVNEWIRTQSIAEAYVDFDEVLRDPGDPTFLAAEYDSGDGIHPNDAGYEAMAEAIDPNSIWDQRGPDR